MAAEAFVDLYDLLGVEPDADKETRRKAYLKKSRKLHPDKNPDPNAAALFDAVKQAYDTLNDPSKKAAFDKERAAVLHQQERFKAMDAARAAKKTSLEERERQAEARANKVVRQNAARELAAFRAANRRVVEELVEEEMAQRQERAARRSAAEAAATAARSTADAAASAAVEDPVASLPLKEREVFATLALAARKRRKAGGGGGGGGAAVAAEEGRR